MKDRGGLPSKQGTYAGLELEWYGIGVTLGTLNLQGGKSKRTRYGLQTIRSENPM